MLQYVGFVCVLGGELASGEECKYDEDTEVTYSYMSTLQKSNQQLLLTFVVNSCTEQTEKMIFYAKFEPLLIFCSTLMNVTVSRLKNDNRNQLFISVKRYKFPGKKKKKKKKKRSRRNIYLCYQIVHTIQFYTSFDART